tara:strand:- start:467 stop:649 length:183 start_codon:yes stop_codon:yes gene_type:complete
MNKEYCVLNEFLDVFKFDRQVYDNTQDETQNEQVDSLRVIKKEVVDLSDMVDKVSGVVLV